MLSITPFGDYFNCEVLKSIAQASEYKPATKQPSVGIVSWKPSVLSLCLKINWKLRVSTAAFVFLAYICKTDVKKPWGKKNAEIEYIFGFSFTAALKKFILSRRSSNQDANGFIEG